MTDVPVQPACAHTSLSLADSGAAVCRDCIGVWIPSYAVAGMIAEEADKMATMTASMMWDFHQRAVREYGKEIADTLLPDKQTPEETFSMFEFDPKDCPDHKYNAGQCIHCGASQFLGG